MSSKSIIISGFLLFISSIFSMNIAEVSFKYDNISSMELNDLGFDLDKQTKTVGLTFPILLYRRSFVLLSKSQYSFVDIDLENNESFENAKFNTFNAIGYMKDNKRYFLGLMLFGADKTLEDAFDNSLNSFVIAGYIKGGKDLTYGYGFGVGTMSDEFVLIPGFLINWKISEKNRLTGMLPFNLSFMHTQNKYLKYGIESKLMMDSIFFDYDNEELETQTTSVTLNPTLKLTPIKNLEISLNARYSIYNDITVTKRLDERDVSDGSYDYSFGLKISYGIK